MKQWMGRLYQGFVKRKGRLGFLVILFLGIGVIGGTTAWTSINQQAVNTGQNTVEKKEVYLQKYEKDAEGKETTTPLSGAAFYLYHVEKEGDTQIGGRYTTDDKGKISVSLAPGDYYFEEISPSTGYTYDKDDQGNPLKRYPFSVTAQSTTEQAIVVAYNQRVVGSLEVTKTVENKDSSSLTKEQRNQKFLFLVTFSDQGTYTYQIDGGEKQALKSGETMTLTHGQKAIFTDLPVGVQYIVTEQSVEGYQPFADNSSGTITTNPTMVPFVNTYDPQVGQLTIQKEIVNGDGSTIKEDQEKLDFTFDVTFSDGGTYAYTTNTGRKGTITSGESVTLKHKETLTITKLPIGVSYTIHEQATPEYTASPSDVQGTIRSKETVFLPFINQYQLDTKTPGRLTFKKEVIANQVDKDQVFTFEVNFSDKGTYAYTIDEGERQSVTSGQTIQIKAGQTVRFPELPAGIGYQIKEQALEGYEAQLTETSGAILSNHEQTFTFHNYRKETSQLVVKKVGIGEGFDANQVFTFTVSINGKEHAEKIQLKAGETSASIPVSIGDTWRVVEDDVYGQHYSQIELINGTGVVTQANQTITVTQTNTYTAPVMTTLSGKKTWSIPEGTTVTIPETITVNLKQGETTVATQEVSGPEWTYTFHVPKYDEEGNEVVYTIEEERVPGFQPIYESGNLNITNIYQKPVVSRGLPVEKQLTGDQPEQTETFEFRRSPGDEVVSIEGAGTGSFAPVTFTNSGTYTYTITERNKGTLGYTYDKAVYTWTLVVVEQEGQLVIQSETLTKDGDEYSAGTIIFENQYEPSLDEKVTIKGKKTWNYGSQPVGKRPTTITVYLRANGKITYQKEVSDEDNWAYSFTVNARDKDGKLIDYTIDEQAIPNYKTTINGTDLTNTYNEPTEPPASSSEPPGSSSGNKGTSSGTGKTNTKTLPSTGEVVGAVALVGVLLAGGTGVILYYRKRKQS